MQMAIYFDQTICTACYACIVSCKDWHDIPAGPASWMRLKTIEKGRYPNIFVANLINPCFHCSSPSCITVCSVGAISKRAEDGIVIVDRDLCIGKDDCANCLEACPYKSPQFGAEENAKMQKCDFCLDRLSEGKKPICVDSCTMRALDFGPLEELRKKYGISINAEGFIYDRKLKPAIVFNPKQDKKRRRINKVVLSPVLQNIKHGGEYV